MRHIALSMSAVFALTLAACGGRVAQPVNTVREIDSKLSCAHLKAERVNNDFRITELTGERSESVRDNLGMLISSPLFLDMKNSEKTESQALLRRNTRLTLLMLGADCYDALGIAHLIAPAGSAPASPAPPMAGS